MSTHRAWLRVAIIAAILTAGCSARIHIVKPDAGNLYDPVTAVVVNYTPDFNPTYSWYVDLDSTGLATKLSPAATPGGTSSVAIDVNTLSAGSHTVTAQQTCGTFCAYGSESVTFTPPALRYNTTGWISVNLDLTQFAPTPAWVGVQNFRSVPIAVTIKEISSPNRVKLAPSTGSAPGPFLARGTPLTVTIPATTTKVDFYIQGDVKGPYVLRFEAPGVFSGGGGGEVK